LRYDRGMGTQADSEIVVPASPEETWQAVTDPERLAEWLGEASELDLRPGGDLRIALPDGERSGFVEEVEEPHRLVFWWCERDGESSRVEIDLCPARSGTLVRVTESRPLDGLTAAAAPPRARALAAA
jgi:uncharacterized protein YndB with AHSA1/START domain